ncbi:MAG: cupin domain-containing protein [Chloroflexi bacterium]|nr:cupin domain-containing protein [Chloroflexota bacterium]
MTRVEAATADSVQTPASAYKSPYEQWKESQRLDTIRGFHVPNLLDLELKPWLARGTVAGAFINLDGTGGFNDTYVLEIPPQAQVEPWRHIFEETIFILKGHGSTTVWTEEGKKQTFEWNERSYFSLPPNAWHQHFNLSGSEPVRYVAMTSAPRIIDSFKDLDFVFNNPYVFRSKFNSEENYFAEKAGTNLTNFVADVLARNPVPGGVTTGGRGGGTVAQGYNMVNGSVRSHSQAWPSGAHSTFHRHGPGIHVILLQGRGYTRLGPTWEELERVDWGPGSMFVPPEGWWHAHFCTSREHAVFLAIGWGTDKPKPGGKQYDYSKSPQEGGDQYRFSDETPDVHMEFEAELRVNGAVCRMGAVHPHCTFK